MVTSLACNDDSSQQEQDSGEANDKPVCGNGLLEADERCDDGNTLSGDGCSASCLPSGTPTQCVTLLRGEGSLDDQVDALLPLGNSSSFVAAGSMRKDEALVAWIGQWSDAGEQAWLTMIPPGAGQTTARLRDITGDGQGGYWVALARPGAAALVHVDSAGVVTDGPPLPDPSLRRLRWVGDRLWAAGSLQGDMWLAMLDDSELEVVLLEDHLGFDDSIGAMEVHDDRVFVVATLGTSPSSVDDVPQTPTTTLVVISFDHGGVELGREALDVGSLETASASVVRGAADRWIVAGAAPPLQPVLQRPQIWLTDAAHGWTWNSLSVFGPQQGSTPQGGASIAGIVPLDTGVILAGGSLTNSAAALDATGWVLEFDGAGRVVWEQSTHDSQEPHYRETALAIHANGRIHAAGVGWSEGVSSTLRACILER